MVRGQAGGRDELRDVRVERVVAVAVDLFDIPGDRRQPILEAYDVERCSVCAKAEGRGEAEGEVSEGLADEGGEWVMREFKGEVGIGAPLRVDDVDVGGVGEPCGDGEGLAHVTDHDLRR